MTCAGTAMFKTHRREPEQQNIRHGIVYMFFRQDIEQPHQRVVRRHPRSRVSNMHGTPGYATYRDSHCNYPKHSCMNLSFVCMLSMPVAYVARSRQRTNKNPKYSCTNRPRDKALHTSFSKRIWKKLHLRAVSRQNRSQATNIKLLVVSVVTNSTYMQRLYSCRMSATQTPQLSIPKATFAHP